MKELVCATIRQILELVENVPFEQVRTALESGLMSDLLNGKVGLVNRDDFRRVLGLEPFRPTFEVWRTIRLGVHKNAAEYGEVLGLRSDHQDWAMCAMEDPSFHYSEHEVELDLVLVSASELGYRFEKGLCPYVIERARGRGLEECPEEVGPALAMVNDSRESCLHIMTKLIKISCGTHDGQFMICEGKLKCDYKYEFSGEDKLIFVKPRK